MSPAVRNQENVQQPDGNGNGRTQEESEVKGQDDEPPKTINAVVDGADSGKPRTDSGDKSDGTLEPVDCHQTGDAVCCKTCDSTQECEEDIDNPGDYYCRRCWEEYTLVLSQQLQVREAGSVSDKDIKCSTAANETSLHLELETTDSQNQSEYCTESLKQLHTQTLSPLGLELSQPPQKMDSQQELRLDSNDLPSGTSHVLSSPQCDGCSAKDTSDANALIATGDALPDFDTSKCDANANDLDDSDEKGSSAISEEIHNAVNPAGTPCPSEKDNRGCKNNVDVEKGSFDDFNDSNCKDGKAEAPVNGKNQSSTYKYDKELVVDVVGDEVTGFGSAKQDEVIPRVKPAVADDLETKNTHDKNDECQKNGGRDPNVLKVDLSEMVDEPVGEGSDMNPAASDVDKEHDKNDEEDDQYLSFGTQEIADPFKVNGLLTQAGSLSGDDGNTSDAMNEDNQHQERDAMPLDSMVENKGTPDSANDLNGTKDHQMPIIGQVVMSGLTESSPNPFQSNHLHIEDNDPVLLEDMPGTTEANLGRGDRPDTPGVGETEDLYGAETQILPSTTVHSSVNAMQVENTDHPQQSNLHDSLGNGDVENLLRVGSDTHTGLEATDVTRHAHYCPSENMTKDCTEMKLTPEKGLLSMVSYPNDHLENKSEVEARVSSNIAKDHPPRVENLGSQNQLSQDLLEEHYTSKKEMKELSGIVESEPPTSLVSDLNVHERSKGGEEAMEWLSSRNESRSPRLILSEKSGTDKESEKNAFDKTVAGQDSFDANESDDSSMFGRGAHPHEHDSLEDTQTQDNTHEKKISNFKRLSRGTSMSRDEGSSSKSSSRRFSARAFNASLGHKHIRCDESKSVITPKVLKYPNYDHIDSHSEWEDDERSCAEITKERYHVEQSQTNYRAIKQLEKVKQFTKHLPSADELYELAARKDLLDEITELNRSHLEEVTKLKRDLSKLRHEIRQKDVFINKMDKEIKERDEDIKKTHSALKEKNDIIKEQSRAIKDLMSRLGAISSPMSAHRGEQSSAKDATEEDSDDGSVVLSALKQPCTSSMASREYETDKRQQTVSRKLDAHSSPFSSEVWKVLQEKGWKYKTGPEPYNKVYVPPDGATHAGTLLGIHFFHGEQVVGAAIERGHIAENRGSSNSVKEIAKNEWSNSQPAGESAGQISIAPMDDSELIGHSKLITMETAIMSVELAASFMDEDLKSVSFKGFLVSPLWQRLKVQGAESNLNWRYEKCKISSLSRNWCFVPPSSKAGSRGERGVDFYVTEEEVVHSVLREAISVVSLSTLFPNASAPISALMQILTRAVDDNMEFKDALEGKCAKTRTRRQTVALFHDFEEQTSSAKKRLKSVSPKTKTPAAEKRKISSTSLSDTWTSTGKKKKVGANSSSTFHSSQTQGNDPVTSFVNLNNTSASGPLSKYKFFTSGIDKAHSIDARIRKLGGQVITISKDTAEKSHGTLFFLSDYTCWRRPKYIFAAALGVPMLHYEWLTDLEKKVREGGNAKAMSSDLYQKHRLPIGLDHSTGVYPLQRASHAREWLRPGLIGKDEGELIFKGMAIAIAVDPATESEWHAILSALGASVVTVNSSKLRGKGQIHDLDCCLLSSAMLPPQATSTPVHVSEMMRHIPDGVPLLDLAWAHQSIIQRKRLPLDGDPRYKARLVGNAIEVLHEIYSFKNKSRRYEVGDLVQFSNSSRTTSFGRILKIRWSKQGSQLELQLLEKTGEFELTDCPSSVNLIIDENCLDGNIVMLGSKDIRNLGYISKNCLSNTIFRQVKPLNESQV